MALNKVIYSMPVSSLAQGGAGGGDTGGERAAPGEQGT